MLPEGHKPVCRSCYDLDCGKCADKNKVFPKCQCDCNGKKEENVKPNIYKLDVVAENGVPFRVVALVNGKSENFSTASMGDRTLVEFYDRRYDFTPDGQFVSRYYLDTMLEHSGGLNLHGGVDSWSLDSVTFRQVRGWLQSLVDSDSVRV